MSIRGVAQLKGLTLRYCDLGGSSRGARQFIRENLVSWAEKNPQTQVETAIKRNKHPQLIGEYVWGEPKIVTVKNMSPEEILANAQRLRNSSGRKMTRLAEPVKSRTPSVQGVWDPTTPFQRLEFQVSTKLQTTSRVNMGGGTKHEASR
eukprot:CAMPEP_0118964122 /NCGR_PEP_ID=MMETSP1173-20130426/1869_1 /TAXON_ID=1034831 /ORGANISM="Rhizochromulina marina cf, Strain CCMP1243" /LENGTH=148 /DNA_ID=CAMNT_0006912545 /DNA_START=10 /DNA_END=453 /DNA_ORIENTATION=-